MSRICAIIKIKLQPFDFFHPMPSATPAPEHAPQVRLDGKRRGIGLSEEPAEVAQLWLDQRTAEGDSAFPGLIKVARTKE
jgi:hypothetical protein